MASALDDYIGKSARVRLCLGCSECRICRDGTIWCRATVDRLGRGICQFVEVYGQREKPPRGQFWERGGTL